MCGLKFNKILFLALMFTSCAHLKLSTLIVQHEDDWVMYGGCPERHNVSIDNLNSPLDSVWGYDAGAGFGESNVAVIDSFLFVGNLRGEIHSLRIGTGKQEGIYDFGSAIMGTPIVHDNILYIALANDNEGIVAYNLKTAKVVWQKKIGNIESSPLLIDERLFVTTLEGKLICLKIINGDIVWTYELPTEQKLKTSHSSPASDGRTIVFGCDNGFLYSVDIRSGQLLWQAKTRSAILASPSIRSGKIFVGSTDSTFYAFNITSGYQEWAKPLFGRIQSSQAVDDKYVYVGTVAKSFYCMKIDDGEIVWKTTLGGVINSAPIIAGKNIYVGCLNKTLYSIDVATGNILWQCKTDGRIKTMPIISKGFLIVLTDNRSIIAFCGRNKQ